MSFHDLEVYIGQLRRREMIKALLKKWFIGDGVLSGYVRHGLTFLAGILVAKGYVSVEHAGSLVDLLVNILTSPEVIAGIGAFIAGKTASSVRRVETKKELREFTKELNVANKELREH